eukprot:1192978-Prorocentrum_minimum.AAC.1
MMSGTDATVLLTLIGDPPSRAWAPPLEQNKKHFEKGSEDTFKVARGDPFGEVKAVKVELSGSGMMDGWYLDRVKVRPAWMLWAVEWMLRAVEWMLRAVERMLRAVEWIG